MVSKGVLRDRARGMRKQPSAAEQALWDALRNRQVCGAKFRRQYTVLNFIADFACVDAKLIVEVDGKSHDDATVYDAVRSEALAAEGWRIVRVRDDEVIADVALVVRRVAAALSAD